MTIEFLTGVIGFLFLSLMYLLYKIQKLEATVSLMSSIINVHSTLITVVMKNIPALPAKSSVQESKEVINSIPENTVVK
jgi:hypothetical protein